MENIEKIEVNVTGDARELVIRQGNAIPAKEPEVVNIDGTITAPFVWIEKKGTYTPDHVAFENHIVVDRDNMSITLIENERSPYRNTIKGSLQFSKEYKTLGINDGKYVNTLQLAERIKMNLACFENRAEAMELVFALKNFKAKVNKDLENSTNDRGSRTLAMIQAVESNIPEAFNFLIPLFKGTEKVPVKCEVYINPDDLSCTIVSAEANAMVADVSGAYIDSELDKIQKLCKIAIIEI